MSTQEPGQLYFADRREGDDYTPLRWRFNRFGVPMDWTGSTVTIKLVTQDLTPTVVLDGVACDAPTTDGWLTYDVDSGDTSVLVPGRYWGQFTVTLADGSIWISPKIGLRIEAVL